MNLFFLLDGLQLKLEKCVKFLGMHVDNVLSWSYHVDALCKKLYSGLFVLRNIVKMASESVALSVYFALLHSHISNGIALWDSCSQCDMERVFKLQKRAVRYTCGLGEMTRASHISQGQTY